MIKLRKSSRHSSMHDISSKVFMFLIFSFGGRVHAQEIGSDSGDDISFEENNNYVLSPDIAPQPSQHDTNPSSGRFERFDGGEPFVEDSHAGSQQQVVKAIEVPYANSPIYLARLAKIEHDVYLTLSKYENEMKKRLQILQGYIRDYKDSVLINKKSSDVDDGWKMAITVSSHPILAYRMIRRFSKYLNEFQDHIWKSLENEVYESLENIRGPIILPTEVDLESAARSVMRIQDVHDFDINFFAAGAIRDHSVQIGLTAEQCLEISKTALKLDLLNSATEWFQIAHSKVTLGRNDESIGLDDLTEAWEATYTRFQSVWPLSIFKTHDVFSEAKVLLRKDFELLKMNRTYDHRIANYKALCRGDRIRSPKEEFDLICYYDNSVHPYWLLQPIKVEIHNWNPLVYQVYDFIGPRHTVDINVEDTIPGSVESVESGAAIDQNVYADKSFTSFWIPDELGSDHLKKLSKRVGMLTHRLGRLGPQFHFSTFAVGNHYEPCVECFEVDNRVFDEGQPKLVINMILHEPDVGGELAFTLSGALVPVVRSSLIFYTFRANREVEQRNLHGGCPVVIGQKWVATKWIY